MNDHIAKLKSTNYESDYGINRCHGNCQINAHLMQCLMHSANYNASQYFWPYLK